MPRQGLHTGIGVLGSLRTLPVTHRSYRLLAPIYSASHLPTSAQVRSSFPDLQDRIQAWLVLFDDLLVIKNNFLILKNGFLIFQDLFLIGDHVGFGQRQSDDSAAA